jgi:hypothetical protein
LNLDAVGLRLGESAAEHVAYKEATSAHAAAIDLLNSASLGSPYSPGELVRLQTFISHMEESQRSFLTATSTRLSPDALLSRRERKRIGRASDRRQLPSGKRS